MAVNIRHKHHPGGNDRGAGAGAEFGLPTRCERGRNLFFVVPGPGVVMTVRRANRPGNPQFEISNRRFQRRRALFQAIPLSPR